MVTVLTGMAGCCAGSELRRVHGARPGVACGQTITTSVVLRADLACAGRWSDHRGRRGDGAGWPATRSRRPMAPAMGVRFGIPLTPTQSIGVRRRRPSAAARISGFSRGVFGGSCDPHSNEVSSLKLEGNTWGVYLQSGYAEVTIDHTTIVGPNGIGGPFAAARLAGGVVAVALPDPGDRSRRLQRALGVRSRAPSTPAGSTAARPSPSSTATSPSPAAAFHGVSVDCSDSDVAIIEHVVGGTVGTGPSAGTTSRATASSVRDPASAPRSGATRTWPTVIDSEFTGWDTGYARARARPRSPATRSVNNGTGLTACTTSGLQRHDQRQLVLRQPAAPGLVLPRARGTWVERGGPQRWARHRRPEPALTVIDDGGNVARRNLAAAVRGSCLRHASVTGRNRV